jgi:hypothetical protein
MAIIHRIGTPENDSEARAIKRFAKDLPTITTSSTTSS